MFQDGLLFQVYEKCLLLRQMTTSGLFQKDSSEKLHMRVEPNEIMDESYMQLLLRKAEGENEVPALGANDFSLFQKDSSEKLHMRVLSPTRYLMKATCKYYCAKQKAKTKKLQHPGFARPPGPHY